MLIRNVILWCVFLSAVTGQAQEWDTLKVGVVHKPPFVIRDGDTFTGLSVDLWNSIAREGAVQFEFVEFNDHLGLIRALDFEEIDISINPIHVNEVRLALFDVTQPFYVSFLGVATSQAKQNQVQVFLNNFFSLQFLRLLLLLVITIFIFGTILWLVERRHNRRQFRPNILGLFDGFWWSAVTMTTVGYGDKAPKTKLGRAIAMIWMFTAILIISAFTATVASTLTVNSLVSNIEDLEDLRSADNIGSVHGSGAEFFLKAHDIYPELMYDNVENALLALSARNVEVLIFDKTELDYLIAKMQLEGKVFLLPVNFNLQYKSFFLPKDSKHLEWINPLLVRKINEESWQELLRDYNLERD
jgi:ABC-type amino acid transport substrate-binding protein